MTLPLLIINLTNIAFLYALYTNTTLAQRGAYEMAYYETFGKLPIQSAVIEHVEVFDNGQRMWTHYERFTPCWWAVGPDNHGDQHVWPTIVPLPIDD